MRATADGLVCDVVDLYDSRTGLWSTAQLSLARRELSATSVGTVAIFAGGLNYDSELFEVVFLLCEGLFIALGRCTFGLW
jgi:hypothetical protein